jgi:hypothetical protein
MNLHFGLPIAQGEKFQDKFSKRAAGSTEAFHQILEHASSSPLLAQAVQAMEGAEQTRFNRKKERIEKGEGRVRKEREESVYKKVQRLADNLRLIALFERRGL